MGFVSWICNTVRSGYNHNCQNKWSHPHHNLVPRSNLLLHIHYHYHRHLCVLFLSRSDHFHNYPLRFEHLVRVYTLLVMSFMSALIVVASIETNKRPDGIYTSKSLPGRLKCNHFQEWLPFTSNEVFSRIASKANILTWERASIVGVSVNEPLLGESYWLYNFTGYCVGRVD